MIKVRESSLSYSAMKKKEVKRIKEENERQIAKLKIELSSVSKTVSEILSISEALEAKREALEELFGIHTKGEIPRWKILTWYNEGKRITKYFLNLEKRHFKQGTVSQL